MADWWAIRGHAVRRYLVLEVWEGERPAGLVTAVHPVLDHVCAVCDRLNAAWRGYIGGFPASEVLVRDGSAPDVLVHPAGCVGSELTERSDDPCGSDRGGSSLPLGPTEHRGACSADSV